MFSTFEALRLLCVLFICLMYSTFEALRLSRALYIYLNSNTP